MWRSNAREKIVAWDAEVSAEQAEERSRRNVREKSIREAMSQLRREESGCKLSPQRKGNQVLQSGQFGHIAAKCSKKDSNVNNCNAITQQDNRVYKTVVIKGKKIIALFDTDSDLHLIPAKQYIKLGLPALTSRNSMQRHKNKCCNNVRQFCKQRHNRWRNIRAGHVYDIW